MSIGAEIVITEAHPSVTTDTYTDFTEFQDRLRTVMHQTGLLES
jgi:hypothetical protein